VVTGATPLAGAFATAERHDHAVARLPPGHVGPDLLDHAAELVADDHGKLRDDADPRPVALPDVPVAPADPVRLDAKDHAVRQERRVRDVANDEGLLRGLENGGAHGCAYTRRSARDNPLPRHPVPLDVDRRRGYAPAAADCRDGPARRLLAP